MQVLMMQHNSEAFKADFGRQAVEGEIKRLKLFVTIKRNERTFPSDSESSLLEIPL